MIQNGEGIRTTTTAVAGGQITVNVGPNDTSVEISIAGSEKVESVPVPPNKDAVVTVPAVPPGSYVLITVGKGLRTRVIVVEVIALAP